MTHTPTDRSTPSMRARRSVHDEDDDDAGRSRLARAGGRVTPPRPFDRAEVPPAERARLAASLGPVLRAARRRVRLSTRGLAEEAGCAARTVVRLEQGQMRPRRSLLASLSEVLDPADPEALTSRLCAAAGGSLRPDTAASLRARRRRARRGAKEHVRLIRRHRAVRDGWMRIAARTFDAATTRALDLASWPEATAADVEREALAFRQIAADLDASEAMNREARALEVRIARRPSVPVTIP